MLGKMITAFVALTVVFTMPTKFRLALEEF
jgi:hypothetical protein